MGHPRRYHGNCRKSKKLSQLKSHFHVFDLTFSAVKIYRYLCRVSILWLLFLKKGIKSLFRFVKRKSGSPKVKLYHKAQFQTPHPWPKLFPFLSSGVIPTAGSSQLQLFWLSSPRVATSRKQSFCILGNKTLCCHHRKIHFWFFFFKRDNQQPLIQGNSGFL